ncbi:MAG: hypothetical protein JOZ17_02090 [Acetobacteraceae bacterium]|nr:hypothetical protein [Acetobacteraceae bacterium]
MREAFQYSRRKNRQRRYCGSSTQRIAQFLHVNPRRLVGSAIARADRSPRTAWLQLEGLALAALARRPLEQRELPRQFLQLTLARLGDRLIECRLFPTQLH